MPISSLKVLADSTQLDQVQETIQQSQHAEVAVVKGNYLVVVVETESAKQTRDQFDMIAQLPGVIQVWVAYYSVEEENDEVFTA